MNIISKNTFKDAFFNEFHEEDFWRELLKKIPLLQSGQVEEKGYRDNCLKDLVPFYLHELGEADCSTDYFIFLVAIGEGFLPAQEIMERRFYEMTNTNVDLCRSPSMLIYLLKSLSEGKTFPDAFLKKNLQFMPEVLKHCVIPNGTVEKIKERISWFSVFDFFNILFTLHESKTSSEIHWIKEEAIKLEKRFNEYIESKSPLTQGAIEEEIRDEFALSLDEVRQIIKEMKE